MLNSIFAKVKKISNSFLAKLNLQSLFLQCKIIYPNQSVNTVGFSFIVLIFLNSGLPKRS